MPNPRLTSLRKTARSLAGGTALLTTLAFFRSFHTIDYLELLTPSGAGQSNSAQGFLQFQYVTSPTPEPRTALLHTASLDPFQSPTPFLNETLFDRHYISYANYLDCAGLGFRFCLATRRENHRLILQLPEWTIAATALLTCYALRKRTPPRPLRPTLPQLPLRHPRHPHPLPRVRHFPPGCHGLNTISVFSPCLMCSRRALCTRSQLPIKSLCAPPKRRLP